MRPSHKMIETDDRPAFTGPKVRWGVLGAAKIALNAVIPAMQHSECSTVTAIASRELARARSAARILGIPRFYDSYQELLADREVEAVYIPLPNHLHVDWAIAAAEAGKHVLVEKPIGLNAVDAERLIGVRDRTGKMIQEAFMIRSHPQWLTVAEMVSDGRIGDLRSVMGHFSYFNDAPSNVRNVAEFGGGGLLDIGCYLVHVSRWMADRQPIRVVAAIERDARFGVDRLTSLILDFGTLQAIGTCSMQAVPFQRVEIVGTRRRVEIEIPFNPPPTRAARFIVDDGSGGPGGGTQMQVESADQYTRQGDAFSRAIRDGAAQPLSLEDSVLNMRVIDALFRSAETGSWERP
ncbi:MAG TPA: Gfo/Idh/MocA family oxidoreductase [Gemmatimonadaceae bacterium]|nr:Gfo/Idh/MocA family oxidoreductase [Gemmatimonadaceae bacterium]